MARGEPPEGGSQGTDGGWRTRVTPLALVGAALLGAVAVAPTRPSGASCPAPGEGRVGCLVLEGWVPWVTAILLITVGIHLALVLAFRGLPHVVARWRAGERLRVRVPGRDPARLAGDAGLANDPRLAAATWAHTDRSAAATGTLSLFAWSRAAHRARTSAALAATVAPATSPGPPVPVGRTARSAVRGPVVTPRTRDRSRLPAMRVVLVSAALDEAGLATTRRALVPVAGELRRIVVLGVPPGTRQPDAGPGTVEAVAALGEVAGTHGGHLVVVCDSPALRDALTGRPTVHAVSSTVEAMRLATRLVGVRDGPGTQAPWTDVRSRRTGEGST